MAQPSIDGILLEWGSQLYYPRPRRTKAGEDPNLVPLFGSGAKALRAKSPAEIRSRIAATVRRAPQVMVKITGGARGMKAMRAHFQYISKRGKLELVDETGRSATGREVVGELSEDWQLAGAYIPETSSRKEALQIIFSMPAGTDEHGLRSAVRELADREFAKHKHVHVFHGHQANPHVHLVVRSEDCFGKRLNPRKADLQRWREGFAEALRQRGIDAQATRQPTHGAIRSDQPIWRTCTAIGGSRGLSVDLRRRNPKMQTLQAALIAWGHIHNALARSSDASDQALALHIKNYLRNAPAVHELLAAKGERTVTVQEAQSKQPNAIVPRER